jgi:hypothetical protein
VKVYMLEVRRQQKRWRERGERQRKWASLKAAAKSVSNPSLRRLLRTLGERRP